MKCDSDSFMNELKQALENMLEDPVKRQEFDSAMDELVNNYHKTKSINLLEQDLNAAAKIVNFSREDKDE